ncbi:MAG: hypothetical protein ACP6IQ_00575 [Candidatus Njordarchaeia archaeon]
MSSSNFYELIRRRLETIETYVERIKKLLNAEKTLKKTSEKDYKTFKAELYHVNLDKDNVEIIVRVYPKIEIERELLSLFYLSELFPDESALISGNLQGYGDVIQISKIVNKELAQYELRRIINKFKRAMNALSNPAIRQKLLIEKRKLDDLRKDPIRNANEISLIIMRINELLFYETAME